MAEVIELTDAIDSARQLIYLRNMAGVSRCHLTDFGHKPIADGFFGTIADWFDARAEAGDYAQIIERLIPYVGRVPAIDRTLNALYDTFPVLKPKELARQPAQTP